MIGRIPLAVVLVLVFVGVLLIVLASPLFPFTQEELKQVEKTQLVADKSFVFSIYADIPFDIDANETLTIVMTADRKINLSIVRYTSISEATTCYSLNDTESVDTSWKPYFTGKYHLRFNSNEQASDIWGFPMTAVKLKAIREWRQEELVTITHNYSYIDNVRGYGTGVFLLFSGIFALLAFHLIPRSRGMGDAVIAADLRNSAKSVNQELEH